MRVTDTHVYMIGNAHIDPVWLWDVAEGYETVRSTFRSALDRMKETPGFVFTCAQGVTYRWIEESAPEMFAEIAERVREGRWELAGGWWVQPDCNLPSGESFIRQALYAQRYFQSRFGKTAEIGYNVDSFGHNGMLPQLLRKCGMRGYVFFRPGPPEKSLPAGLFRWLSPDGSEVLACRPPHHYGTGGFYDKDGMRARVVQAANEAPLGLPEVLCFYGVGNHGGGPTQENLRAIVELQSEPGLSAVHLGSLGAFFDAAQGHAAQLPVVTDDLQHHAPGCYSVHSEIKRNNRTCEDALTTAEKLCALATSFTGCDYPTAEFEAAWQRILFNQFHDIMAGTSIKAAYEEARNSHGYALDVARAHTIRATQTMARQLDTVGEGQAVVVWNPSSWERDAALDLETNVQWPSRVLDESGVELPAQRLQSHATAGSRSRVALRMELPPLGYRTLHVVSGEPAAADSALHVAGTALENESLRVRLDSDTGHVAEITSKTDGTSFLSAPACVPLVLDDQTDTWSHDLTRYTEELGSFTARSTRVVETGPLRGTLRVESVWGDSTIRQDFSLFAGLPIIEVRMRIDWREQFRVLKLVVPTAAAADPLATYGMPFGAISKPCDGHEEPGQGWIDVSGRNASGRQLGVSLLCPGKYGFDALGSTLRMTVLRSPIYAWHDPAKPDPEAEYEFIDQGRQDFVYWLVPHRGDWRQADPLRRLEELAVRPVAHAESTHPGARPRQGAFVTIAPENVVLGALKRAEDDPTALIARLHETKGLATDATVELAGTTWQGLFAPHEVKTLRLSDGRAGEVSMLER